jgi:NAD(P)-dependent dehydrogenase (short-subunit alcohol dehydrogenase family)
MKARRKGAIVNIGSVNGLTALGDAAYSAGKAGMISLTRSLAMEFGRYGIRVNIVCPGTVRTPIWEERASRNPEILGSSGDGIRSGASSSRSR